MLGWMLFSSPAFRLDTCKTFLPRMLLLEKVDPTDDSPAAAAPQLGFPHGTESLSALITSVSKIHLQKAVVSILCCLVCLVALEALARVVVTTGRPAQNGSGEADAKYEIATKPASSQPTLLLIGSSLSSRGIYSDLLARRLAQGGLPMDVRNIAMSGSWPPDQLLLLDVAIKSGVRPAAVICDVSPLYFISQIDFEHQYSENVRKSYRLSMLAARPHDLFGNADLWLRRMSYLYRFRPYLKAWLASLTQVVFAPDESMRQIPMSATMGETSMTGWAPAYTVPSLPQLTQSMIDETAYMKYLVKSSQKADSRNTGECRALDPLRVYCGEKKIPLILVFLPVHAMSEKFYRDVCHHTLEEITRGFSSLSDNKSVYFWDLHEDPEISHFFTFDHLNASGAVAATERLAKALNTARMRALLSKPQSEPL